MHIDFDDRFWSKCCPEALSGCWLWHASVDRDGYGTFYHETRTIGAHRHAWALSNGPVPAGMFVRHKCDVPACVNPDHLELGTHAQNMRDMTERGRQARGEVLAKLKRGELAPHAKLTAAQVSEIRSTYAQGDVTRAELARRYGVSQVQIGNVVRGKCW
jgi:hypothetical protein